MSKHNKNYIIPSPDINREGFFSNINDALPLLDANDIRRAVTRIAHEIIERNRGSQDLVIVGIHTRGVPLAYRLAEEISRIENTTIVVGELDITSHRDDAVYYVRSTGHITTIPISLTDKKVILTDEVIFTGRTVRAAMDALVEHGRPASIQLATLIDRGHRELPIRPDYVGKNLPTSKNERVMVRLKELDNIDGVWVYRDAKDEVVNE
jgi:pyrimidine operon attenuation protein/uracil phosphoribosyltransferase